MWARLAFAMTAMLLIHNFPSPSQALAAGSKERNIPTYYFLLVVASTVLSSFASTVQFVGISAFHTIIADPAIGGTYMTVSRNFLASHGILTLHMLIRRLPLVVLASKYGLQPGRNVAALLCLARSRLLHHRHVLDPITRRRGRDPDSLSGVCIGAWQSSLCGPGRDMPHGARRLLHHLQHLFDSRRNIAGDIRSTDSATFAR